MTHGWSASSLQRVPTPVRWVRSPTSSTPQPPTGYSATGYIAPNGMFAGGQQGDPCQAGSEAGGSEKHGQIRRIRGSLWSTLWGLNDQSLWSSEWTLVNATLLPRTRSLNPGSSQMWTLVLIRFVTEIARRL